MYASDLYGSTPSPQPTPTGTPDHAGSPEPFAKTLPDSGILGNPTLLLVAILGVAIALIGTIRVSVSVEA
jgi:hypothetical protein